MEGSVLFNSSLYRCHMWHTPIKPFYFPVHHGNRLSKLLSIPVKIEETILYKNESKITEDVFMQTIFRAIAHISRLRPFSWYNYLSKLIRTFERYTKWIIFPHFQSTSFQYIHAYTHVCFEIIKFISHYFMIVSFKQYCFNVSWFLALRICMKKV